MKSDAGINALITNITRPCQFERAGAGAALAATDDPINICKIHTMKRTQERFKAQELDGRAAISKVIDPIEIVLVFDTNAHPNII